jgi:DNA mismatch endonuclease (patch repair protein)
MALKKTISCDPLSPRQRSCRMAKIRSSETKPEKLVRSLLHRSGFRFLKNIKDLPGCPDVVLPRYRTVIFINGCFWHRHSCKLGQKIPTNNQRYWTSKFERNVKRDNENYKKLISEGWKVITIWECELKFQEEVKNRLLEELKSKITG